MGTKGNKSLIESFSADVSLAEAFEILFENASDAIYILDKHGNFVAINREAEELTGFKREDWIGKSFRKIIPARSLPKAIRGFLNVIRGKSIKLELELKTAFKKTVLVEVTSKPLIIKGKTVGTLGIARDITERKNPEERIRESEKKYRNLFENARDTIMALDLKGNITDVNRVIEEYGFKKDELIGKNMLKLVPKKYWSRLLKELAKVIRGKPIEGEIEIVTPKGKIISEYRSNLIRRGKKVIGSQTILRDVTERRQMEKKLQEYSEHLEELVEKRTRQLKDAHEQLLKAERLVAIGEMAAMVGHDLRNPLTGIAGATYYLKTKIESKMDKTAKDMVELIEKGIEYSDKIISDLLEYSREINLDLTETNPKSITKQALTLVKVPKNIRILNLADDKPKIKIDVQKMKRVLVNIIKNAVEPMPKGRKLAIKSKKTNGKLEIAFTDTGIGIRKEILEKIWTPLFTTKAKGIGLGLPVCKRIVEAHGGNISVESTVGKGTTFTVTIPIKPKLEGGEKIWVKPLESLLSKTTRG